MNDVYLDAEMEAWEKASDNDCGNFDSNHIAEAHKVQSKRILENIGITINLTEMPEHREYADYYLDRSRLTRFLLRTFKRTKVMELKFNAKSAFLLAVLEEGDGLIE